MENEKLKNFGLSDFNRQFIGSEQNEEGILTYQKIKDSYDLNIEKFDDEDEEIIHVFLDSLKKTGKSPYQLSPQELNYLRHSDISLWCDYLVFRYKFIQYPKLKKVAKFPVYLLIEPVSACNLRCVMCFQVDKTFTRKPYMGTMSLDFFKKIIDDAVAGGTKAITLASRGEPLMHKQISEMLNYIDGKFLETKLNTNATLLTEDLCHDILSANITELTFSIDAEEKELYEKIRVRGKFENVINNIKRFKEIRKKHYPNSVTKTTASGVFFHEEQDVENYSNFFSDIVDNVAVCNIENRWNTYINELHPDLDSPCEYLWQRMYVWFDGIANPCDVDYKSNLEVGNFHNNSISEIWNGELYNQMRKKHLIKKRNELNPCDRCGLG